MGVISYYDTVNADLKMIHCNNLQCTNYLAFAQDMLGNTGKYTSIAIGKDDLPIIAYVGVDSVLMVVHCSNELCIPINWEH